FCDIAWHHVPRLSTQHRPRFVTEAGTFTTASRFHDFWLIYTFDRSAELHCERAASIDLDVIADYTDGN
ncbi:MAG TPA: hypothetical protein PKG76_12040, partial [Acidobacteriota bacterium]|nr:hypothetical protein [Acidobacteriota bacterium]